MRQRGRLTPVCQARATHLPRNELQGRDMRLSCAKGRQNGHNITHQTHNALNILGTCSSIIRDCNRKKQEGKSRSNLQEENKTRGAKRSSAGRTVTFKRVRVMLRRSSKLNFSSRSALLQYSSKWPLIARALSHRPLRTLSLHIFHRRLWFVLFFLCFYLSVSLNDLSLLSFSG